VAVAPRLELLEHPRGAPQWAVAERERQRLRLVREEPEVVELRIPVGVRRFVPRALLGCHFARQHFTHGDELQVDRLHDAGMLAPKIRGNHRPQVSPLRKKTAVTQDTGH
jgi:hypothetical protein